MRAIYTFAGLLAVLLSVGQSAVAQQFQANYVPSTGRPTNLVACGDVDTAAYRLELAPSQPQARNVQVTVQLFAGMEAVGFDATRSTAGVTLVSLADPTRPVVSLPNLVPTATGRFADFGLVLRARCAVLDTIANHDDQGGASPIEIFDRLSVRYDDLSGATRTELRDVDPYRAAIAGPVFSITDALSREPLRVDETVTRTITISNGSFRGYADTVRYRVAQGRDARIDAIRINGVARAFAKTVGVQGDTVITIVLSGDDFLANINGAAAGNGDRRFDPDESLLIEEDLTVLSCGPRRFGAHSVAFGCDQNVCVRAANVSELPIGSGQPELRIKKAAVFPDQNVGYCQPGELTVWVANVGRETDPTFGEAHNLSISALFSDISASLATGGYVITELNIAGVPVPDVAFAQRLDTLAGFDVDPDGPGGLDDLDGDGAYDDLAVLDSFPLKVFFEMDCSVLDDDLLDENCANDAFTTVQVFAYFNDQCGSRLNGRDINLFSPQNMQDDFEQRTQPDAFAEGAPFQIELEFGRLVFRFDESACQADAEMRAYVELPPGVTIDPGTSVITRGGGTPMPVLGVSQTGNMAMVRFDPSAEPNLTGVYTLVVGMLADCSAPLGETIFPTSVAYYCPGCDCEHTWICEDIVGPWVHKTSPPCPVASLYPCPQGIQGASFEINRTTTGFADPNFLTPMAPQDVERKVAIPADSVSIVMAGVAGDNVVSDSLGVILHYFTPNDKLDTAGLFLLGSGQLEWFDGAAWQTCRIGTTPHTMENDTTETWQRFDLSACLTDNGWNIQPGDSVRFLGMFEINPLGPILDTYEFVTDLRGGFFATEGGVETQCDQFGDTFRVGKPLTTFGVPSNGNFPRGCAATSLEFKITGINRGYQEEFGLEYRRAARLDSIVLDFDTTILTAFDDLNLQLYVAGHPTQGSFFYDVPPLTTASDGRYVLRLDTLDYSAELVSNYSFLYNLRLEMTPNCSSIRGSANDDQFYPITAEPYYKDRYYAIDISDGSRVDEVADTIPFVMSYDDPARLDLEVLPPSFQRIASDSAFVEIEVCNTSTRSRAARSWVIFNDTTDLLVEAVQLIDDRDAPVDLDVEPYADGHFVNMEALERVNGLNTSAQVCNLLRVKVRAIGCGLSQLQFATGWDCEAAVPAGWTPSADLDCVDDAGLVEIESVSAFLEADLIEEPTAPIALCTPVVLEFQVNNAQPGTAYDVLSRFYVPPGLQYVAGSAEVEYPSNPAGDSFQPTIADLVPADTSVRGYGLQFADLTSVHPFLASRGLMGFDATNPTDSNRFTLRLTFETDCDFRSGSIVFFETEGEEACGDRTNFAAAESAAIQILGTTPDGSHGYAVGFDDARRVSLVSPVSTLEVFAQHVGTDPTDADDVLQITLPDGFAYEPNSSAGLTPAGYAPGEPIVTMRGRVTMLEWPLPIGMQPGEEARLSFDVRPDAVACGDAAQADIAAIRYVSTLCVSQGTTCRIPTDITQGGAQLVNLPIGEVFDVTVLENESTCESATTEAVTIRVSLAPAGFAFTGAPLEAALYADVDGDQLAGPGDRLLDQQQLPNAAGDASVVYSFGGSLERANLDKLLIRIDSVGQPLCAPQTIVLPLVELQNAGDEDLYTICADEDATLQLGDANCAGDPDLLIAWSTEPAGYVDLLDDFTSPTPTITVPPDYAGPDTVLFVLTTNRIGLGVTRDTAAVIISSGVVLNDVAPEVIDYGTSVVLTPDVQAGNAPFTYAWTPAASLSGGSEPQPVASPEFDQLYTVTVTDRFGCTGSATHLVRVRNPIVPTANVQDTTICPDASLTLTVGGGSVVTWTASPTNPIQGGINAATGSPVLFSSAGGVGVYAYEVNVSDPAFPGYDSTITVTVTVDPDAGCRDRCDFPQLVSEVTHASACDAPTGSIALVYDATIADYDVYFVDAADDTLGRDQLTFTDLGVGAYRLVAVSRLDTVCNFEATYYVNGETAPEANVTTTDADCGASNGTAVLAPATLNYLWEDGDTRASRSDLAVGSYRVGVSSDEDPGCVRYQLVEVGQRGGLDVQVSVDQNPDCGQADGSATLTVTGGSGDYDYGWSVNAATNTNLVSGVYNVAVTDRVSGCVGYARFVLADAVPGATLALDAASAPSCAGAADGRIDFTAAYDASVALPVDTALTNVRGEAVSNGGLRAGLYFVRLTDAAGCTLAGLAVELEAHPALRLDIEASPACGFDNGAVAITTRSGQAPLSFDFSNGLSSVTSPVSGFAPGSYTLDVTDAAGCTASTSVAIGQCPPCNYTTGAADTTVAQTSCEGTAPICISGIADRASDLQIYTNGAPYAGDLEPCDYGRTRLTYLVGVLDFSVPVEARITINGDEIVEDVSSLTELVAVFEDNDPLGGWYYDAASLSVVGGQRAGTYSTLEVQRRGSTLVNTIPYNERIEPFGLAVALGVGTHEIVVYDSVAACADTLYANVVCAPVDTLVVTVPVGDSTGFCVSTEDLLGTLTGLDDTCVDTTYATYGAPVDTCVTVYGNFVGEQQACYVACDDAGVCDTTIVLVNVVPSSDALVWRDTIFVNDDGELCLTAAEVGLAADPITITNTCAGGSGATVDYFVNDATTCVEYDGLTAGEESACLTICDAAGNCVDGTLIVTVVPETKAVYHRRIFVNQTDSVCIDSLGVLTDASFFRRADDLVESALSEDGQCAVFRGLELGTDTLGYEAVRPDGTPFQACIIIEVVPFDGVPEAVDDATCTQRNTPIRLNILANDQVFGGVASLEIVDGPAASDGTVVVNADNTVTFTPAPDMCARDVTFTYRVCNPNPGACDLAVVTVCVECDELVIFTAMSPNGDGVNDVFYIAKIEDFPNNEVQLFNRWGTLVHREQGYKNTWQGTYRGDPLPDGAYFYIVEVTTEGVTTKYNGYVEIMR